MKFEHTPVLLQESIDMLDIKSDGIYVDATLGGAGHSEAIAARLDAGRLIGIDRDANAIRAATEALLPFGARVTIVHDNFKNIKDILKRCDVGPIDGALLDLGVSSHQLDEPSRGFSYMTDAALDMRMDRSAPVSAYDVVNGYSEPQLSRMIYEYGEERWSKRIAQFIIQQRQKTPIATTGELVRVIEAAIPKAVRTEGGHPAKRTFQAIRIEVNGELTILKQAIQDFADALKPGGRLAVITFHSLEDRIVKNVFSSLEKGCVCPKDFPICVCGARPTLKVLTKKPIISGDEELSANTRAKSAKLRAAEKL